MSLKRKIDTQHFILVVDDEEEILRMQLRTLRRRYQNVDLARNGKEALEKFKERTYDLVVTDLRMPQMDGETLIQKLSEAKIDTEIIVCTGHGDLMDAYTLLDQFHISDFIQKPMAVSRVQFAVQSVLERRRIRRELSFAKTYTENILSSMSDALIVLSPELMIQSVNAAALKILGYQEDEVLEIPLIKVLGVPDDVVGSPGEEVDQVRQNWLHNLCAESFSNEEFHLVSKFGNTVPVLISGSLIKNGDGSTQSIVLIAKDITEIKSAQIQLIQASKLVSLGEMATGVAHEINQPLTFINTTLFEMEEDFECDDIDPEETIESIKEARHQVKRITQIIQHMRVFGRQEVHSMEAVALIKVIQNGLLLLNERMRLNSIKLNYQPDENIPKVLGNPNQLEQIFINLFQNAIDALEGNSGAEISLELENLEDLETVVIRFSDNGTGIPQEIIDKIFEPFYTTKEVGKGTGLGLSVTHGIVKAHQGSISCDSELGKGTTFTIHLPQAAGVLGSLNS